MSKSQSGEDIDFLVSGFCGGEATYTPLRDAMSEASGNPTILIGSDRWGGTLSVNYGTHPRALDLQAHHVAKQVVAAKEALDMQAAKARIYCHSLGAAGSMLAAAHYLPLDMELELTLLAPACLRREGWALVVRTLRKGLNDIQAAKHHPDAAVRELMALRGPGMRNYMANPIRTFREGLALVSTDLYTPLSARLQKRGVTLRVAYAEHDELFPHLPGQFRLEGENAFVLEGTTHDVHYYPKQTTEQLALNGAL